MTLMHLTSKQNKVIIRSVDTSPSVQQHLNRLQSPVPSSQVKRSQACLRLNVDISLPMKQSFHDIHVPTSGGHINGARSCSFWTSLSAPKSNSTRTTPTCPSDAAKSRAFPKKCPAKSIVVRFLATHENVDDLGIPSMRCPHN
jgi:hypothetical protein